MTRSHTTRKERAQTPEKEKDLGGFGAPDKTIIKNEGDDVTIETIKWRMENGEDERRPHTIHCAATKSFVTFYAYKMEEPSKVIAVSASSAEAIVQDAAVRIGLATDNSTLQNVCNRLKEELVIEEWQLQFIDSFQWKELGAPIGLVAAIRRTILEQQQMKQPTVAASGDSETSSKKRSTRPNDIVETNDPEIPPTILVEHILPMLNDRKTWNNLRSTSKETYETSQKLISNGKIAPPWPQKRIDVTSNVHSVAFSPDGALLAYVCQDGVVRIRNGQNGQHSILEGHPSTVNHICFSPSGSILASASSDGTRTTHLWTLADRSCRLLELQFDCVTFVAFSPDGSTVASGCRGGSTRIWNVSSGMCTRVLSSIHIDIVWSIAFSPDGRTLASAGGRQTDDDDDEEEEMAGRILLWDLSGENDVIVIYAHWKEVNAIAYSPDGRYLASGGDDCTIKLWNAAIHSTRSCAVVFEGHTSVVWSVCFSPNGKILASGSEDGSVRLWNVDAAGDGSCLVHLRSHHRDSLRSIAFSPDGRTLATGSWDGTVRLWNPNEHKQERDWDKLKRDWDKLIRLWKLPT
jgi:WD40 repeat protein